MADEVTGGISDQQIKPAQILVVDDDESIREMISFALLREGYEVRSADNGREALGLLAAVPTDLIITDLVMPQCDGYELITAIRKGFPQIKIIAISGNEVSGKKVGLLNIADHMGAHITLMKPFSLTVLRLTVKDLLQGQTGMV